MSVRQMRLLDREALRPSPQRSLALAAAGAVIGLLIAAYGLFTAQGTRIAGVPAENVALVNQVPILRSDYLAQLRAVHNVGLAEATPAQRRDVLEAMIRDELYVQRGLELGRATDDADVRAALVASAEATTVTDVVASVPSEREIEAFHGEHLDRYASEGLMQLEDLLLPDAVSAESATPLRDAIASGQRPAGLDRTLLFAGGPEYYFAARIHLGPSLFAAAAPLKSGQASAVILVDGRWHVLVMMRNEPPQPLPLTAMVDRVLADMRREKSTQIEQANARFLRRRADIQIATDLQ